MTFPIKTWKKLSYENKRSSYNNGIIGEVVLKENRRVIDSVRFKNNHEFNLAMSIMKKYGFNLLANKDEIKEEISFLNLQRQKDEKEKSESIKENNWLDKKDGDMEW